MLQQLCVVSSGRKKARWRQYKLKCRRRNTEVLSQQLLRYQIMNRSQRTVTKYLSDKKTHAAINSKLFIKLDYVNNSMYKVELAKAQI